VLGTQWSRRVTPFGEQPNRERERQKEGQRAYPRGLRMGMLPLRIHHAQWTDTAQNELQKARTTTKRDPKVKERSESTQNVLRMRSESIQNGNTLLRMHAQKKSNCDTQHHPTYAMHSTQNHTAWLHFQRRQPRTRKNSQHMDSEHTENELQNVQHALRMNRNHPRRVEHTLLQETTHNTYAFL
jgi:hypothetical protein